MSNRETWMRRALELARQAADVGEVPVGAVIVAGDAVVGEGFNRRETANSAILHAEIVAIDQACRNLGSWRLSKCEIYVTLEPCLMCAGALVQSRIGKVYFGALDPKGGALGSLYKVHEDARLNHNFVVEGLILAEESTALLQNFFRARR